MSNRTQPLSRPTTLPCAPLAPTRSRPFPSRLLFVGGHKTGLVLLVAGAIATAGCHKNAPASSTTSASQQAQPEVAASPNQEVQPGAAPGTAQPLDGEVDPFMTSQLHIFIEQKGRLPTDFAELAHTRLDVVPRTPAGGTWAIDPLTQEVKLVKK